MRSIAEQTDAELGGPLSILVCQKRDHVRLDELLEQLQRANAGADQETVLNRIARLVFPHAFAEEAVLWPAMRRALPAGAALTLQVEQEHQEINDLWSRLESGNLAGSTRERIIGRLVEVLRADVRDEEDQLLPQLQESVDVARLQRLGLAWTAVRRTAPTRPHPLVSRRPPGNVLAALPLSLLDRGRDVLDAASRSVPGNAAGALRVASHALAGAAVRVEHTALLRRGEDPSTRRS